jgi:hypothetical protein
MGSICYTLSASKKVSEEELEMHNFGFPIFILLISFLVLLRLFYFWGKRKRKSNFEKVAWALGYREPEKSEPVLSALHQLKFFQRSFARGSCEASLDFLFEKVSPKFSLYLFDTKFYYYEIGNKHQTVAAIRFISIVLPQFKVMPNTFMNNAYEYLNRDLSFQRKPEAEKVNPFISPQGPQDLKILGNPQDLVFLQQNEIANAISQIFPNIVEAQGEWAFIYRLRRGKRIKVEDLSQFSEKVHHLATLLTKYLPNRD